MLGVPLPGALVQLAGQGLLPPLRLRRWVPALGGILTIQYAAMFLSTQRVTPGLASVLAITGPIFLVLFGAAILGARIGWRTAGALALGAIGVSLIAWPGGARSGGSVWDVSLPLTVAVGAAVETVLFKYLRVGRALLAVAGWQLVLGKLCTSMAPRVGTPRPRAVGGSPKA